MWRIGVVYDCDMWMFTNSTISVYKDMPCIMPYFVSKRTIVFVLINILYS